MEAYKHIDLQHIELIKYQPLYSPFVEYGTDRDYNFNYLRGKLCQFCFRWIYDLKEKSVFSPYSELLIPQYIELPNGNFVDDFMLNNYIGVKIQMGNEMVDKIEIAVREGNNGNLNIFKKVEKHTEGIVTGRFVKNGNYLYNIGLNGGLTIDDLEEGFILDDPDVGYLIDGECYIINIDKENGKVYLNTTIGSDDWRHFSCAIKLDERYVIFRGIEEKITVPTDEANQNFDNIPLLSGSMEVIEEDRLLLGDNTSGFDKTDLIAELEITHSEVDSFLEKPPLNNSRLNTSIANRSELFLQYDLSIQDNSIISININFDDSSNIGFNLQKTPNKTIVDLVDETISILTDYFEGAEESIVTLQFLIDRNPTFWNYDPTELYGAGIGDYARTWAVYNGNIYFYKFQEGATTGNAPSGDDTDNNFWVYADVVENANLIIRAQKIETIKISSYYAYNYEPQLVYPIFKYGEEQIFAIEYVDHAGRTTGVHRNDNLNFKNKSYDEVDITKINRSNSLINSLTIKLNNQPPEFAYAYRILMAKNTPWFFQFYFNGLSNDSPDVEFVGDKCHIKINRAIQALIDNNSKSFLSSYIFEKGERIRIIAQYKRYRGFTKEWVRATKMVDMEILEVNYPETTDSYKKDDATGDDQEFLRDEKGNKIRDTSTSYIVIDKPSEYTMFNGDYIIYEIYRPVKEVSETTPFYRISKTYGIENAGTSERYHKGEVDQDLAAGTPVECNINRGNVYRKMRYSGVEGMAFPVESMHISDFYDSDSISIGRSNIDFGDVGQIREIATMKFSEKYVHNTEINGLVKFPAKNVEKLKVEDGKITGMVEDGYILRILQERQLTSIYIGRTVIQDQAGNNQITMLKDKVFGTDFRWSGEAGCQDARTIIKSPKHVYFLDNDKKKWYRIAYNGLVDISEYGMSNYFEELTDGFNRSSIKNICVGFDVRRDELLVTYRYRESADYNLSLTGKLTDGNAIYKVGYNGGATVDQLEVGMIIEGDTFPLYTYILMIDKANKKIYMSNDYSSADDTAITENFYKKFNIVTWAFHESTNSWKTRYPFNADYYGRVKDELFSFFNGKIWMHEKLISNGSYVYNNFHGIQFNQEITFSISMKGKNVLFKGITIISNKPWGAKEKGDVLCKSYDRNDDIDIESMLPIAKFKKVHGKYVSEFLRDMNSSGYDTDNEKLLNGRFLNGQAMQLKLSNEETNEVVLFGIIIYFSLNENF